MSRQRESNIVGCARVEHMKQDALAGFHSNRLAMTEGFVVERSGAIHDLHAVVRRRPLSYVLHADEFRIPLMRREKNFSVVIAGVAFGLDVKKTKLSGVQATAQIVAGDSVGVIPAGS